MSAQSAALPASPGLWRAFMLHAAAAGAFGLLTIFWGEPSVHVMSVAGGLYLLALAAAVHLTVRSLRTEAAVPAVLAPLAPVLLAAVGLLNLLVHDDAVFAWSGTLALGVMGVTDLLLWGRTRRTAAARDFLLLGGISVVTAALLPSVLALGAHALLGVAGGGAVITAVVLALAALSYRHDAREQSGPAARANPVN